mgnify:CR=1 FL=1
MTEQEAIASAAKEAANYNCRMTVFYCPFQEYEEQYWGYAPTDSAQFLAEHQTATIRIFLDAKGNEIYRVKLDPTNPALAVTNYSSNCKPKK